MLVFVPGLMQYLPQPTLAAVVIVASLSLADIGGIVRLWHQRRTEFGLAVAAFLGVAFLGVLPGLVIAVALSILWVFRQVWNPYRTELVDVPDVPGYHDTRMYPDAEPIPGLVIYRFDGPLIFANAKTFRDEVRAIARTDPPPSWIIIAAEPITTLDTTAAHILEDLDKELEGKGINLVFAEMKDAVRHEVGGYGLTWLEDRDAFYPTIGTAVKAYRLAAGIPKPARAHAPEPGDHGSEGQPGRS